jgi:DNA-binding NtrC family response regulator
MMKENIILLVDADRDCEDLVWKAAVRKDREVLVAKTSREALAILRNRMRYLQLVIVDVDPGAHALALLEAVSGCAEKPPMIVMTALEETYMKPIAIEHGAAACLGKPVALGKLKSVIDDVSAKRSLTCDRWGSLVLRPTSKGSNLKTGFRGIATKLSPVVTTRRKYS